MSNAEQILLDQTLTADGDSTTISWPGGEGLLTAEGTWGSGTLTPKISGGGATFQSMRDDLGAISWTADNQTLFRLPAGVQIKCTLASSSSPSLRIVIRRQFGYY
jgi:hypothetical protein